MLQLNETLSLECTKISVPCTSKKRALEMLAQIAADHGNLNSEALFECLLEREKLGSTAIGNGVAMPHGKIQLDQYQSENESDDASHTTPEAIAVLITSEEPIDFDAPDNRPIEVLFALFVPENQCNEHMQTLSSVAKALGEPATVKQLRYAESDQALFNILSDAYVEVVKAQNDEAVE